MPTSDPERTARFIRLRRSVDFQRVQSSGKKFRSRHLLMIAASGGSAESRVGWAVSRKVGNAVRRNLIKRWLREATRGWSMSVGATWDVVLIPRSEIAVGGFGVLTREVAELFERLPR